MFAGFKADRNYFEKVHQNKIASKRHYQKTLNFKIWKTYQKEALKGP